MPKHAKPQVHARDHEHGGADVTRVHYEDVGDEGAGGGGLAQGIYALDSGTSLGGGLHLFQWSHAYADTLLDLTDDYHPTVLTAGVYAYNFDAEPSFPSSSFVLHTGDHATYGFTAMGSSGFQAFFRESLYQPLDTAIPSPPSFLDVSGSVVVYQDPASDDGAFAWMSVTNYITTALTLKYTGSVFVQKVT